MILFRKLKAVVPRFGLYADDFFCNPGTGRRISAGKYCHAKSVNRAAWSGGNHDHRGRDLDWL